MSADVKFRACVECGQTKLVKLDWAAEDQDNEQAPCWHCSRLSGRIGWKPSFQPAPRGHDSTPIPHGDEAAKLAQRHSERLAGMLEDIMAGDEGAVLPMLPKANPKAQAKRPEWWRQHYEAWPYHLLHVHKSKAEFRREYLRWASGRAERTRATKVINREQRDYLLDKLTKATVAKQQAETKIEGHLKRRLPLAEMGEGATVAWIDKEVERLRKVTRRNAQTVEQCRAKLAPFEAEETPESASQEWAEDAFLDPEV